MSVTWDIRPEKGRFRVCVRDESGAVLRQSDSAVTSARAARMLGKSRRHVYRYVERGLLTPLGKFFDEWLFDAGQVERFRKMQSLGRIPLRRPVIPAGFGTFFPDYRLKEMNPWTNAALIITRILDTGTRAEWRWVFRHYPRSLVRAVIRDHGVRLMSERSHHFWTWLLGVDGRQPHSGGRPARRGL